LVPNSKSIADATRWDIIGKGVKRWCHLKSCPLERRCGELSVVDKAIFQDFANAIVEIYDVSGIRQML